MGDKTWFYQQRWRQGAFQNTEGTPDDPQFLRLKDQVEHCQALLDTLQHSPPELYWLCVPTVIDAFAKLLEIIKGT